MGIGTAMLLGAATLWSLQIVTKDLQKADKRTSQSVRRIKKVS